MDFKAHKKSIWIAGASIIAILVILLSYLWYRSFRAVRYAVAPAAVMAITGNDYEATLKKLHNLPLIQEIENDGEFEILESNDFLKNEIAHAPEFKKALVGKKHVISFKVDANHQLQSLLAFEGDEDLLNKIKNEVLGADYGFSSYSSPAGEIIEAFNSNKRKELVLSYTNGVIVITNEALFAEETLKSISGHKSLFKKASLDFSSNFIYLKQAALQKWVEGVTLNNNSEFIQWFEFIDEMEFGISEDGTLAKTKVYFSSNPKNQKISVENVPLQLENWLQHITSNYIAFHPDNSHSEITLSELYRCYTNLQDENINNNTFITAKSNLDSGALMTIFKKHSIANYSVLNQYQIYKFGKYPFFKNFCNAITPDLPESYITILGEGVFVVASSVSSMIPILEKIKNHPVAIKNSLPTVFVMQVQPQHLLPYLSNIVKKEYSDHVLNSSFLKQLDFVQYRLDVIDGNSATGNIFFNKNALEKAVTTELLWSKILEQDAKYFSVIKGKNDNDDYILYQDDKDVLHCMDFKTNEIFQKYTLGKIQSTIYHTDLFRNGQSQFIFNTSNQIYALHSNGSDLNSFPKPINNESIKGMYLFDMGDKYEYFFVQGNSIFGFDAGGVSLKDWRPRQSPVFIQRDLIHFRKRNNNYIVGISRKGDVLIWNRFGKRVERNISFGSTGLSKFFVTPPVNKRYRPELIATDTTGRVYSITLDSLRRKEYRYKLTSDNAKYFVAQTQDSLFQKIIYQNKGKLLCFDRYTQTTDTFALTNKFELRNVFNVEDKLTFIILNNGESNKILNSFKKVVAENIQGDIMEIIPAEVPDSYFVITFDQLKRVNLYKFSW